MCKHIHVHIINKKPINILQSFQSKWANMLGFKVDLCESAKLVRNGLKLFDWRGTVAARGGHIWAMY
jgi:hypothetical protein